MKIYRIVYIILNTCDYNIEGFRMNESFIERMG